MDANLQGEQQRLLARIISTPRTVTDVDAHKLKTDKLEAAIRKLKLKRTKGGGEDARVPFVRVNMGLALTYQPQWVEWHAYRELWQNWRDAIMETNPSVPDFESVLITVTAQGPSCIVTACLDGVEVGRVAYTPDASGGDRGVLEFVTWDATITRGSIAMGVTKKGDDIRMAGKFGEGIKMTAMVCVRLGKKFTIEGTETWTFVAEIDATLGTEMVFVHLRPKPADATARRNVTAKVEGVTPQDWEEMRHKVAFLWAAENPAHYHRTPNGNGAVVADPAKKGWVYVNGLFVKHETTFAECGYDLPKLALNRDREIWTDIKLVYTAVSKVWKNLSEIQLAELADVFVALASTTSPDFELLNISAIPPSIMLPAFVRRYGDAAYPYWSHTYLKLMRWWREDALPTRFYRHSWLAPLFPPHKDLLQIAGATSRPPGNVASDMADWADRVSPVLTMVAPNFRSNKVKVVKFPHQYLNWEANADGTIYIDEKYFAGKDMLTTLLQILLAASSKSTSGAPSSENYFNA